MDSYKIRYIICQYLKTNPTVFDNVKLSDITELDSITIENYITSMEKPSTWGGGIELSAFCTVFNIQVDVYSQPNNKTIEFLPMACYIDNKINKCIGKIAIAWNGGHFEPIRDSCKAFNN
jgi:hypothetical protein